MSWFVFILGAVMLYITYKQLFGYGIWGTLWRVAAALVCAVLIALVLLGIDFSVHMLQTGDYNFASGMKLFMQLLVRMLTNSDV